MSEADELMVEAMKESLKCGIYFNEEKWKLVKEITDEVMEMIDGKCNSTDSQ